MSSPPPPKTSKVVWLLRAIAVVIVVAAFIVAGSVDDEDSKWYLRTAVTIVYLFSFVGAVNMFMNTFRSDVQHTRFVKQAMGVVWLLIVAGLGILVRLYAF